MVYKKFGATTTWVVGFGTWIASFAILTGMLSDIYGVASIITAGKYVLLSGPVNLAIQSITSFALTNKNKKKGVDVSIPKIIFDIVSLVASILGIISFYLEYMIN